jgi:hypothetical protein
MAKKKAVVLRYISDPGHGWVEAPVELLKTLRLGTDFTRRGNLCYLEEDEEATRLDRALKKRGITVTFADSEVYDFDSWLGGDDWPYVAARVHGDDIELVVYALESMGQQAKQLGRDKNRPAEERKVFAIQHSDLCRLSLMFSTMKGAVSDG